MMQIPKVSLDVWQELYHAAEQLRLLEPWNYFDDSEIFAVKDPDSGEMAYFCFLGAARQVFGLCLYRGQRGFDFHQALNSGELDPEIDDAFILQDALLAEFADKIDLEKEDLAIQKAIGFKSKKRSQFPSNPLFRSLVPGYAPWFLSEPEAKLLTQALKCAVDLIETFEEDESFLDEQEIDQFLTYSPKRTGDSISWEKSWQKHDISNDFKIIEVRPNEITIKEIQNLNLERDTAWEADVFALSGPIFLDEDRPYWARMTMVAHQKSGHVFGVEMLKPKDDAATYMADEILNAIKKTSMLPREVFVRQDWMFESFKPLADRLGVRLRLRRKLSAINEAKESLLEEIDSENLDFEKDLPPFH